ncbi:hypothetical protein OAF34_07075, partial [Pirellulaceae bacterium]|nr:hypothetical protein [Pirellulaceae bacterium]
NQPESDITEIGRHSAGTCFTMRIGLDQKYLLKHSRRLSYFSGRMPAEIKMPGKIRRNFFCAKNKSSQVKCPSGGDVFYDNDSESTFYVAAFIFD